MKFLHLSDLHIGKTVNGFSMLAEQRFAFDQILRYIKTETPPVDAAVVAGDVYDRALPGVEAVRLLDDFLTELVLENVKVLIIAGNHDSPERLSYGSRLFAARGVYFSGAFEGIPERITLYDEGSPVHFWLLPYVRHGAVSGNNRVPADNLDRPPHSPGERETVSAPDDAGRSPAIPAPDDVYGNPTNIIRRVIETAPINYAERNVLVSHQFYTGAGCVPVTSDSEMNPVGGLDAVDAEVAARFDYAALGHLHGAQKIFAEHIRYAGSPVKYSFSEIHQKKSVTLVTLGRKGEREIKTLPITPIHEMREIKGKLEEVTRSGFIAQGNREDYLRIVLTDEAEIIDPMPKLRAVYPNLMSLGFENARTRIELSDIRPDAERIRLLSPLELFGEFFLETGGAVMTEEQQNIVRGML
jgi:exonuclease SbcD